MLRIVGSQIVVICMNLKHSWLGMDNFEMLISIEENWLNEASVGGCASMDRNEHVGGLLSMEKFTKMEETLIDENEDIIASIGLLDLEDDNNKF